MIQFFFYLKLCVYINNVYIFNINKESWLNNNNNNRTNSRDESSGVFYISERIPADYMWNVHFIKPIFLIQSF